MTEGKLYLMKRYYAVASNKTNGLDTAEYNIIARCDRLHHGGMDFSLVASEKSWSSRAFTEIPIPSDVTEIEVGELPQYLDMPYKTELFDEILRGASA